MVCFYKIHCGQTKAQQLPLMKSNHMLFIVHSIQPTFDLKEPQSTVWLRDSVRVIRLINHRMSKVMGRRI